MLLITRSRLYTAQASSYFKWLNTRTRSYVNHTHLDNLSPPSCYFTTAVFNDCYSEVTAYTALVYSYWASFHDVYICLRHANHRYRRLQLPYKSHGTCLTNRIGSISHHTVPLVINSLGGRHTNTHAYRHSLTEAILGNQVRTGLRLVRACFN